MTSLLSIADVISSQNTREERRLESKLHIVKGHTIALDSTDSSQVSGRPGYKWVREQGMNGGVYQVPGIRCPDYVDMPVLIAYNPKEPWKRMILDVDWSALLDMDAYNSQAFMPNHHNDHEWPDYNPGHDVVNVYPRQLVQLRSYAGSSGLAISIAPHRYVYEGELVEFVGEIDLDVSVYQPASGYARYILVYLDKISNSIQIEAGDVVADVPSLTPQPPTFPNTAIWSALVRIDGDQTSFAETDFLDVRSPTGNGVDGYTPEAEGNILISNDGLTFEVGTPMVDANGNIITDENGHIIIGE